VRPDSASLRNPFEFGRELRPDELADRRAEIEAIRRIVENRGKLFLVGPMRFGKTCILAALEDELARDGAVILRCDAEAFETVTALAPAAAAAGAEEEGGRGYALVMANRSFRSISRGAIPAAARHTSRSASTSGAVSDGRQRSTWRC
jgi:hypothetical protein